MFKREKVQLRLLIIQEVLMRKVDLTQGTEQSLSI